ncbi:transforming growth factor-beta receptor type 3-like protein isoform X2 [Pseudophryne corroboree]|uniref:transforming growth factor-beta receptor type 3-like protein isoform X2 n=1 Tax=Pseudophryne corroboree TaxID=495146 RepID=UPI0030819129
MMMTLRKQVHQKKYGAAEVALLLDITTRNLWPKRKQGRLSRHKHSRLPRHEDYRLYVLSPHSKFWTHLQDAIHTPLILIVYFLSRGSLIPEEHCALRMHFLIIVLFCAGLVKGPPPWLSFEIPRDLRLKHLLQAPSTASFPCQYSYDKIFKGPDSPCTSHPLPERSHMDSARVQFLVRGPDKLCEGGSMCSVKVGSRVQAEVSLSAALPILGLSLAQCSLSPSSDPFNNFHIPLLVDDCPVAVGVSLTLVPPKPCTKALPMKSFSFQLGPFYNNSIQFLHCRVQFCSKETLCSSTETMAIPECRIPNDHCDQLTAPPLFLNPELQRTVTQPLLVTISGPSRPLLHPSTGHKKPSPPARREYGVQGVGVVAVVGVTLCSFFIGSLLTAGLWCIHIKTSPDYQVTPSS